jgi:hypothetical protein
MDREREAGRRPAECRFGGRPPATVVPAFNPHPQENAAMATALNMTMKLKQDPASLARLQALKQAFAPQVQKTMEEAMGRSKLIHFARVLVIDDKYIQVLTEFDGDKVVYTEFFRQALPGVFEQIFSLVEGAPPWAELNNRDAFYAYSRTQNVRALGDNATDPEQEGYLFSAYGNKTVKEILPKIGM